MKVFRRTWRDERGRKRTSRYYSVEVIRRRKRYSASTKCTDKRAAERWAAKWLEDLERDEVGLPSKRPRSGQTAPQHLDRYLAELGARRLSKQYRADTTRDLKAYLAHSGALFLGDMTRSSAIAWLTSLEAAGRSARGLNKARAALHAFAAWALKDEEAGLEANPFSSLPTWNEETDRRRERASLTLEELVRLLRAEIPLQRRAAYGIAASTGLRRNETAQLEWPRLDLETGLVLVRASTAKDAQDAWLPLHPLVVELLRAWRDAWEEAPGLHHWKALRRRTGKDLVLPVPNVSTLYRDLLSVGIGQADRKLDPELGLSRQFFMTVRPTGEVLDFHALRGTCATLALAAGAGPAQVQDLMRHSSFALTKKHYARLDVGHLRDAQARIALDPAPAAGTVQQSADTKGGRRKPKAVDLRARTAKERARKAV